MIAQLVKSAADQGVYLYAKEGALHFDLTVAEFPATLKQDIIANKAEIIAFLSHAQSADSESQRPQPGHYPDGCVLSYTQQRFWLLEQMQSGQSQYNMPVALNVEGALELTLVEKVLSTIVARHQILRTVYRERDDEVRQHVLQNSDVTLSFVDLSDCEGEQQQAQLSQCLLEEAQRPFDLTQQHSIRGQYLKLQGTGHTQQGVLLLTLHHIASDGWSMDVLVNEFVTLYRAYSTEQVNPLPELALQYADFAVWQRDKMQGGEFEKQLTYWQQALEDAPLTHSLPTQHHRPEVKQTQSAQVTATLPAYVAQQLGEMARQAQLSPFMLMHAVLGVVLSRHSNQADIVIGTPVANRADEALSPLIGCFVNTLALRLNTCHSTLAEYFAHVRQVHMNAQVNQDVPFEQLIDALNLPRTSSYTPLVQIMLTTNDKFTDGADESSLLNLPDLSLSPLQGSHPAIKFDMEIALNISDKQIETTWNYDVALFDAEFVEQLSEHFNNALIALADMSAQTRRTLPLNRLSILGDKLESYLVDGLNNNAADYPVDQCIHQVFEQQAMQTPDQIAVKFGNKQLTYGELNERANQLAHFLIREYQVTPDTFIGLCVERSLEMIIGTLAILKAGAAYVPLDPAYPRQRVTYMMENSGVKIILSTHFIIEQLDLTDYHSICIDGLGNEQVVQTFVDYATHNPSELVAGLTSSNLAYAIYTSGSTGKPKGVLLEHKGIVNVAFNHRHYLKVDGHSKVLHFASMSFDAGTWEYVMALLNGATLVIADSVQRLSPESISQLLHSEAITHVLLPPAFLAMMEFRDDLALKTLAVGGEACDQEVVEQWGGTYRMVNAYGPTEISICATWAELRPGQKVTIGKPLKNTSAFVLDSNQALLSPGVVGELHISGVGLARGYHQLPEQTAERFVPNPYFDGHNKCVTETLYKTGDLVRYLPDGELEYLGRIDQQVKIRGFRIEVSEIEGLLSECLDVDAAVVTVATSATGAKHLVAYVQLSDQTTVNTASGHKNINDDMVVIQRIKTELADRLPDYMVPGMFVPVSQWPLTSNGKIDKRALPEPDLAAVEGEYIAPETNSEKRLVTIWAQLLHLQESEISTSANFFALGGHSLLVSKLVRAITSDSELQLQQIDMQDIFTAQSLAQLAQHIDLLRMQQLNALAADSICDQDLVEDGEI
ncbi:MULTISPECIES: amino acid adenylation domain-containing protein [unclassified Pseudoalteromonas]|uniref:non-ribosomal peptide synthetase n=1 Tax=unclassified Pseudoalteromonas TaxID=194690 RepID=UPI002096D241|nr:amino acid adenylation domain-containing protein [Pseudoalteromonas sp. XMcav2-N]MCO7191377.1 amino acid adenylation domain-containing protein [Pseudoalteromonas sp. XMcav2-N]